MGCWVIVSFLVVPLVPLVLLVLRLPCCPKRAKQKMATWWLRMVLPFRYDVRIRGLASLSNDKGTIFLPNHPAMIDPFILISHLSARFQIRPVAAEAQASRSKYFKLFGVFPVPDFDYGSNSYQLHRMERLLDDIVGALEHGEHILLYPSGRLMRSGSPFSEFGTSATFDILRRRQDTSSWRVVLVSTHGLWGSRFSRAYGESLPDFFGGLKSGICDIFCNLFFFMPKRRVDVHFEEVSLPDFKDKLELNHWLANWYDQFGTEQLVKPGEEGYVAGKGLVPRRCCSSKSVKDPMTKKDISRPEYHFDPELVSDVQKKLAKHLGVSEDALGLTQSLAFDLGLDSIQLGELVGWLDEEFNVRDVEVTELSDVASVMRVVAGQSTSAAITTGRAAPAGWEKSGRPGVSIEVPGKTLPEAFVRNAKRMGKHVAVGDENSGMITYDRVLLATLLFANFLIAHPELRASGRIGLMMPAAAGVGIVAIAIMLAGCTPVMINWTVGRASLEHVIESTGVKAVITARAFLKKLGPEVDLSCLLKTEGLLVFTEDLKSNSLGGFGLCEKLAAMRASRKSAEQLIKRYRLKDRSPDSEAVVLFTSGSESFPKGVPLSHSNVLANIRGVMERANARDSDAILGTLPPFHSFGFTVTTMGPLVTGIKTAYYPNPTEYRRIAREIMRWKPSLYLGTPTFVTGVLKAAESEQQKSILSLKTAAVKEEVKGQQRKVVPINFEDDAPWPLASLRLVITGAEKTPEDLFNSVSSYTPPIGIIEGYGITETSPVLTANKPGEPRAGVGYALTGVSLAILDTEDYLAKKFTCVAKYLNGKVDGSTGQTGIIAASGPNVFGAPWADPPHGYLGIPLTEKNPFLNFDDKWWYDTGDLGYLEADGALHLAGRLKRFVKIAGEMISLVALEAALKEWVLADGSRPWADGESGPVLGVECYEADGQKPILALVAAVDATLEAANEQLRTAGMPKIAKLTMQIDARTVFDERWASQGTLPLLGTGKTDYAAVKRAVAAAVVAEQKM